MKPNLITLGLVKLVVLSFIELILIYSASAQIPSADSAAIMKYMNDVSLKIENELKKNKELYTDMMDALKKISSIKDTVQLDAALAAYKTKYQAHYGVVVKSAGIDMNKVAVELHIKYPYLIFTVNNLYALEYERSYKTLTYEFKETTTSTTTTTTLTSFEKDEEEGCGGVSGSYAHFDGRKIHVWAGALVAGGCTAIGDLTKKVDIPSDAKSIVLKVNYTLRSKNYAISVGAVASSVSNGTATIRVGNTTLQSDRVEKSALAPVAWYARSNKEKDFTNSIDLTKYKGDQLTIKGHAYASSCSGGPSTSEGNGYSKITKADLIITK